jgi:hypothetical protein
MSHWIARFAARRARRPDFHPRLSAELAPEARMALARSLARFQLGETGTGAHLLAAVDRSGEREFGVALRMFLAEEHDHARWLLRAVLALGGQPLGAHWSARAFVRIRHFGGMRGELFVLLLAEVLGATFYRAMAKHVPDRDLRAILGQIARDEGVHLAFHVDWHRRMLAGLGPVRRALLRVMTGAFFRGVCLVMMFDHRTALRQVGGLWTYWRNSNDLLARVADAILYPAQLRGRALARTAHVQRPAVGV